MVSRSFLLSVIIAFILGCTPQEKGPVGFTEILKWPDGKKAAVSLTYDDGSINQFRIALPMMDKLGFPATFYIVTGQIPGSANQPKFIGRPGAEIIKETADVPTNTENLFERASYAACADFSGMRAYHTEAGALFEQGKVEEACAVIDEVFKKLRAGDFPKKKNEEAARNDADEITWEEIKVIAGRGHEFGSHTITHPRLAVLDEENLLYELEGSKEDIISNLGFEHTFSAECPYGTEDERVMGYAHEIYPALRNRMPEPYLGELNRSSDLLPGDVEKEYVQWQRGPLSATPMSLMRSWIDTCVANDNIWLVLVFHGVEGIGWEAKTTDELDTYFNYIKSREDNLWVGTFADVTKYIRERMNTTLSSEVLKDKIIIELKSSLDPKSYDYPLTLKSYISEDWQTPSVNQQNKSLPFSVSEDDQGRFLLYSAMPDGGSVTITKE